MTALSDPNVLVPEIGTYRFEPSMSSIAFVTKHMFGLGKVTGSFDLADGELVVVEPATNSTVAARATASSFATGNKQRDKQVKSRMFLDLARHPHIEFRSTGITRTTDGWVVAGLLTVRGKAAPIEFTLTATESSGTDVSIRAKTRVDRYAHGITKMKGMAARYLEVDVTVQARRV